MKIGIPKEIHPGELRVATTPEVASNLIAMGFSVSIESGAGDGAHMADESYAAVGVEVVHDTKKLWKEADIILKVRAPELNHKLAIEEYDLIKQGACLVSFIWPAQNSALMQKLAARKLTVLAMDCVPRISRAQKMDALSSMANIAGYRAIVEASQHFSRFFTGQITAAGKIPPAKVLVIGAGVAGLAAIGAAKGMGAIVRSFDTRSEVKEQIESMDAEFLTVNIAEDGTGVGGYAKQMSKEFLEAERRLFAEQAREVDIIVTTALIPGKPAPMLLSKELAASMKPGSVIVDLAAEQGGNCELTQKDRVIAVNGVTIIGYTNMPSRLASQSSQLYATNLRHLLTEICPAKDGVIRVAMDDEVIRGTTVIERGNITWPPPPPKITAAPQPQTEAPAYPEVLALQEEKKKHSTLSQFVLLLLGGALLLGIGAVVPESFMSHFTVFVLSCFIGYQVIWNVAPSLHTPLMSVTNAISGIIIIGALIQLATPNMTVLVLSALAILIATVNIAGGFLVTRRMLEMFRR